MNLAIAVLGELDKRVPCFLHTTPHRPDDIGMPSTLRLLLCVCGIYVSFLSWALVQERLSTTPYYAEPTLHEKPKYFRHVIFLNTVQSTCSSFAALLYISFRKRANAAPWKVAVGLKQASFTSTRRRCIVINRS